MQFDIRRFDIYRKVPKDLTQPTLTGACISIFSVLFILFLFLSELSLFITHDVVSELTVEDPVKHSEKIPVFINLTLPNLNCKYLGLDIRMTWAGMKWASRTILRSLRSTEGTAVGWSLIFSLIRCPVISMFPHTQQKVSPIIQT